MMPGKVEPVTFNATVMRWQNYEEVVSPARLTAECLLCLVEESKVTHFWWTTCHKAAAESKPAGN